VTETNQKPENPLLNIIFNIALPVIVLNKLSDTLGPVRTLLLALAFPISYGIYDLYKRKKINWISVLGLINVMATGGFALIGVGGIWFAVKEAALPFLLGIWVFFSAYSKAPVVDKMLLNPQVINRPLIDERLAALNLTDEFKQLIKRSTLYFSFSFLLSAILNFGLAVKIFTPLNEALGEQERATLLNSQIAEMTSASFLVIMVPSMLALALVMWHLLRGLAQLTNLKIEELMKS
jgi:hypothetical protein